MFISVSRKFADIANTVQKQFQSGMYKIGDWADLVTAHALPGPDMINNMYGDKNGIRERCGCVVILGMSTKNALTSQEYSEGIRMVLRWIPLVLLILSLSIVAAAKWAVDASDVVMGFVGQSPPSYDNPGWIQFTPGVSTTLSTDSKGQQYCSPSQAVSQRGADIIIVGRGLLASSALLTTAESYRLESWVALMQRCNSQDTQLITVA